MRTPPLGGGHHHTGAAVAPFPPTPRSVNAIVQAAAEPRTPPPAVSMGDSPSNIGWPKPRSLSNTAACTPTLADLPRLVVLGCSPAKLVGHSDQLLARCIRELYQKFPQERARLDAACTAILLKPAPPNTRSHYGERTYRTILTNFWQKPSPQLFTPLMALLQAPRQYAPLATVDYDIAAYCIAKIGYNDRAWAPLSFMRLLETAITSAEFRGVSAALHGVYHMVHGPIATYHHLHELTEHAQAALWQVLARTLSFPDNQTKHYHYETINWIVKGLRRPFGVAAPNPYSAPTGW